MKSKNNSGKKLLKSLAFNNKTKSGYAPRSGTSVINKKNKKNCEGRFFSRGHLSWEGLSINPTPLKKLYSRL